VLAGFIYLVKPDQNSWFYLGLTTAIFYPLLLFLPSIMQESLHHALVILMAEFSVIGRYNTGNGAYSSSVFRYFHCFNFKVYLVIDAAAPFSYWNFNKGEVDFTSLA